MNIIINTNNFPTNYLFMIHSMYKTKTKNTSLTRAYTLLQLHAN